MKPAEPNESQKIKDKRREQLEQDIRDYLDKGGKITDANSIPDRPKRKKRNFGNIHIRQS